jgi:hypothetical protein
MSVHCSNTKKSEGKEMINSEMVKSLVVYNKAPRLLEFVAVAFIIIILNISPLYYLCVLQNK